MSRRENSGQNASPTSHSDQATVAANTSRYSAAPNARRSAISVPEAASPRPASAKYQDPPSKIR